MNGNMQVQKPQPSKPLTIRDRLEGQDFKAAVAKALPKHLTPDRFIRIACTAMTKTPKLLQCDQASFFNALLTLSQLGIEPDGRRAHLIPFGDQVQMIIDYKGIVELVMRSGLVSNLHADVVCENDDFAYDMGEIQRHRINFKQPRGAMYAVYCIARFKDGTAKAEVMTVDEVEAVRSRSKAAKNGPWVTDWSEMAKKTVFKRLAKWLTLSPEIRDAVDSDNDTTIDIPPSESFEMPTPARTKPRLGKPEPQPEAEAAEGVKEEVAPKKSKSAPPLPEHEPANPDQDAPETEGGDLGPQEPEKPSERRLSAELAAKLVEIGVSEDSFWKWAASSGRDEQFTADPVAASAKLLADERALKKLQTIYGS